MAGRGDARGDVRHGEADAVDELAFEAAVDGAVGGVAVRIGAAPAVAVDRIVHRIGAVADVVAHAEHIEGAVLLGHGSVRAGCLRRADLAHAHHDAVIGLDRGIGQGAGPAHISARGGAWVAVLDLLVLLVERDHEFVARARDRLHEGELLAEPAVVGVFLDLGEVFGIAAPCVGLGGRGGDIVLVLAQEHRAIGGDRLDRGAVDHRMGGLAPGERGGGGKRDGADGGEGGEAHERLRCDGRSIARAISLPPDTASP
ncbi:hypothetical protein V474_01195 [Novosphingobium barchaimii LL02]|uniref:Uncharacterized protein n=1 Tax=Novosphingobium barchaimii LL02 TaxID=1114963 RepID=A0A0J8B258_9SPHN|nr:hypothetical protein V474_01195 [Novosphingobium barchaimii LL02]